MKLLVEVRDDKARFILELLENFEFVKTQTIQTDKNNLLKGIKEAVDQVNLAKEGKIKLKSAQQLLDEL